MLNPLVFISYSHKDEYEKDELVSHLGVLEAAGLLDQWVDDRIMPGDDWESAIEAAINQAQIAILLVTKNFLNSKFILSEEIPKILHRKQEEGLKIYPIIAKYCAWQKIQWLSKIQITPKEGIPVWGDVKSNPDKTLSEIATEIHDILDDYLVSPDKNKNNLKPPNKTLDTISSNFAINVKEVKNSTNILVMDDNEQLARNIALILAEQGFNTNFETNPHFIRDRVRETNYSLVLLDIRTPHFIFNGIDALVDVKVFSRQTKVILMSGLTGSNMIENVALGMSLGANGFINRHTKTTSDDYVTKVVDVLSSENIYNSMPLNNKLLEYLSVRWRSQSDSLIKANYLEAVMKLVFESIENFLYQRTLHLVTDSKERLSLVFRNIGNDMGLIRNGDLFIVECYDWTTKSNVLSYENFVPNSYLNRDVDGIKIRVNFLYTHTTTQNIEFQDSKRTYKSEYLLQLSYKELFDSILSKDFSEYIINLKKLIV